ncbi:MAG: hypothetical protein IPM23_25230 [Candidatus Melainabacteria bacterium]|nr:hypothetical protein [Candidatus Melainabacteria bacterium]
MSSRSTDLKKLLLAFLLGTGIIAASVATVALSGLQAEEIADWRGFYIFCRSLAPVLAAFFLFFQTFALVTILGRGLYLRARPQRVEKGRENADGINENEKQE